MKRHPSVLRLLPIFMLVFSLTSPLAVTSVSAQDGTPTAAQELTPPDIDGDGFADDVDNCPDATNSDQIDTDADGLGDGCDETPDGDPTSVPDADGDGFPDDADNCSSLANPDQADNDGDGAGNACDDSPNGPDADADGVLDTVDNCPNAPNVDQADADADGVGDICDDTPNPAPEPEKAQIQEADADPPEAPDSGDFAINFVAAGPLSYEHVPNDDGGRYDDGSLIDKTDGVVAWIDGGDVWCGDVVVFLEAITVGDGDPDAPASAVELVTAFDKQTTSGDLIGLADIVDVRINNLKPDPDDPGIDDPGNRDLDGDEIVSFTTSESTETQLRAKVTVDGLDYGERLILRYEVLLRCDREANGAEGDVETELRSAKVVDGKKIDVGDQTVPLLGAGAIRDPEIEISAACPSVPDDARVGDEITYQVTVTNSGTADLTNVSVSASRDGTFDTLFPTTFAPGDVETRSFTSAITADDALSGAVDTTFDVTTDQDVAAAVETDCPFTPVPRITINSSCPSVAADAAAGDPFAYTVTIQNTGDTALTGIVVDETRGGVIDSDFPTTLAPGDRETRTFTSTLSQADFDAGSAAASASVGADQEVGDSATATCPLVQDAAIEITKT